MDAYANLSFARVLVAPAPGTSGTSLQVIAGQGARLPAPPFNATLWPTSEFPDPTVAEIVRVTVLAGDVLTVLRAQEGTTAKEILPGFLVAANPTKRMVDALRDASSFNAGKLDDARLSENVLLRSQIPQAFPVSSVFLTVSPTNPAILLGYGTWIQFGQGRLLLSVDPAQPEFAIPEQVGGSKSHTLTVGELPAHSHPQEPHGHQVTDQKHTHAQTGAHVHPWDEQPHFHEYDMMNPAWPDRTIPSGVSGPDHLLSIAPRTTTPPVTTNLKLEPTTINLADAATGIARVNLRAATNQSQGGGQPHNTLPPYLAIYMWKRAA